MMNQYAAQIDEFSNNAKYCFQNTKKVLTNITNKSDLVKNDIKKIQMQLHDLDYLLKKLTQIDSSFDPKIKSKPQQQPYQEFRMASSEGFKMPDK